jgi:hypothetical protein
MKNSLRNNKSRISRVAIHRLAELLKPYQSGWVSLSPDEQQVLASGKTLHETRERTVSPYAIFVKVIPPTQGHLPFLA